MAYSICRMPAKPVDGGARPDHSCGSTVLAAPAAPCDSNIDRGDLHMGPLEGADTPGLQYFVVWVIYPCSKMRGAGRFTAIFDAVAAPASPTGRPTSGTMVRALRIGLLEDTKAPGWRYCVLGVI